MTYRRVSWTIVALAVLALLLSSSQGWRPANAQSAPSQVSAKGVVAASVPTIIYHPLPRKSLPSQLRAKSRAQLPKVKRQALRILGSAMDQPNGLTDTQIVSALHIRKVFKRKLGPRAFKSALRISWRESRLLPHVVNDQNENETMDWGLFQLNDGGTLQYTGHQADVRILKPKKNARAARYLVLNTGWWPWGGML